MVQQMKILNKNKKKTFGMISKRNMQALLTLKQGVKKKKSLKSSIVATDLTASKESSLWKYGINKEA